jgi:hypothetical protein
MLFPFDTSHAGSVINCGASSALVVLPAAPQKMKMDTELNRAIKNTRVFNVAPLCLEIIPEFLMVQYEANSFRLNRDKLSGASVRRPAH